MRAKFLSAILIIVSVAGVHSVAHAQGLARLQVTHEFTVGTTTLPAGSYTVRHIFPETFNGLLIRSDDGKASAFVLPETFEAKQGGGESKVHFSHNGDAYALTEIDTADGVYLLLPTQHQSQQGQAGSATVSGQ